MRVDIEDLSAEATHIVVNAICWAMFSGDGREVKKNDDGEPVIEMTEEEIARAKAAADRLLLQLALYEHSVAQEDTTPWVESQYGDVWAEQFLANAHEAEDPNVFLTDKGNLTRWFANAIERGWAAGRMSFPSMTTYDIVRCHRDGLPVFIQFGTDGDATWELVTDELVASLTTDVGQVAVRAYVSPSLGGPTPEGS